MALHSHLPAHLPAGSDPEAVAGEAWLARCGPGWTSADEDAFQSWLGADARHLQAFAAIEDSMGFIELHAQSPEWDSLRARAHRPRPAGVGAVSRRALVGGSLAAAASIAALVALSPGSTQQTFTAKPGERRDVVLSDGSRLALDSGATVEARLGPKARALRLVEGQARFDVAHDTGRPFTVEVGDHLVVATGTAFNIDRAAGRVAITLLQGAVEVRPAAGRGPTALLRPGQQFVVDDARGVRVVQLANAEDVTAWRSGKLIFDGTPLAEAVGRVNRYANGRLLTVTPATADLPVTGAFNAGDSEAFAEAVTSYLPLIAAPTADGRVELQPRAGRPQ
ncbi:MAG: anti-FecI sigma factor, FecR [Phenylobacterium sp.]|nr:anti-FecI sigma factor, FecR [Phenylobacterium sp.]